MKKMRNVDGKIWIALSYRVITVLLAVFCCLASGFGRGVAEAQEAEHAVPTGASVVIVQPKFGGQILGYDIASKGSEGLFSEAFAEPNGNTLVATEAFDQKTGAIRSWPKKMVAFLLITTLWKSMPGSRTRPLPARGKESVSNAEPAER